MIDEYDPHNMGLGCIPREMLTASAYRASQFANKFSKFLCHFLSRILTITSFAWGVERSSRSTPTEHINTPTCLRTSAHHTTPCYPRVSRGKLRRAAGSKKNVWTEGG